MQSYLLLYYMFCRWQLSARSVLAATFARRRSGRCAFADYPPHHVDSTCSFSGIIWEWKSSSLIGWTGEFSVRYKKNSTRENDTWPACQRYSLAPGLRAGSTKHTHMMQLSNVEFVVNSSFDSPTFKTHDTIDGEIVFIPHQEPNIEDVTITFKGTWAMEVALPYRY